MPLVIFSRVIKDADMETGFAGEIFACGHDGSVLQFTVSYDGGLTWQTAVDVGSITGGTVKSFTVFQEHASGGSRLRITNGLDLTWTSDDYGATWQVF